MNNNITFKDLILKYLIEEITKENEENENNGLYFSNSALLLNCLNIQSSKRKGGLNVQ